MSSLNPTFTTGLPPDNDPSSLPGGGGGGGGGGDNQMSNLYLYTFLATLLLLLAISMLIVGRSVFIRRRARWEMEEAIRNGSLPPQTTRPTVKLGAKPKLFDVYTTGRRVPDTSPLDDSSVTWANLKPLSAMLKKPVSPTPQAPELQSPTLTQPPPSLLLRLVPQLRPVSQAVPPDSQAYPLEAPQSPRNSILTVSVMIAMPSPPPVNPQNSSEDTFPPVLVGVIHQPVPHGWPIDAKSESG